MLIKNAEFVKSLAKDSAFFNDDKDEIAFIGRSNVGKSSLINYLTNRKTLAKTSSIPGRTRLINYFIINEEFYFVDLPGYGYAKGNKEEQKTWKELMEKYLHRSKNVKLLCLLLDIRRDVSDMDMQMLNYIMHYNLPFIVIVTKADKVAKSKQKILASGIANQIGLGQENVFICSAQEGKGKEEILQKINQFLN